MSQDDEAAKELFEAKRQYHEAEGALAVATARLNRAEGICRALWTKRMLPQQAMTRPKDWHYDSQGYCDNPGRGY